MDEQLWRAAHARLEERRQLYLRGTEGKLCGRPLDGVDRNYLLVGLAQCGRCGGSLEVRSRANGRQRAYIYACSTHRRRGVDICRGVDVPMQQANEFVLSQLQAKLLAPLSDRDVQTRVCQRVVDYFARPARTAGARRLELRQRRSNIDVEISRLVDGIVAGGDSKALAIAIKGRESERDEIDLELASLKEAEPPITLDGVKRGLGVLVREWQAVLLDGPNNIALTRQVVQKLMDERFSFEPETQNEQPGYRCAGMRRGCGSWRRPPTSVKRSSRKPWIPLGRTQIREMYTRGGAPDRIRTCGLQLRRLSLYPAELRAQNHTRW